MEHYEEIKVTIVNFSEKNIGPISLHSMFLDFALKIFPNFCKMTGHWGERERINLDAKFM